jgi:rubrerythrin
MQRFIHRENIKHYRSLLETTTDENERRTILKLLAEEEAKEDAVEHPSVPAARAS